MNKLADKIAGLLPELDERGPVYLFALVEREDVNRWDVVLSASWSDGDYAASVRVVADALRVRLDPSEITTLSRVVIIPSDDARVLEMPNSLEAVVPGPEKLINVTFGESDVRRAFVFKAKRPYRMDTIEELAAAHTAQD